MSASYIRENLLSTLTISVFFGILALATSLGVMPSSGLLTILMGTVIGLGLCTIATRVQVTLPRMLSSFIAVRVSHILSGFLITIFAIYFGRDATIVLAGSVLLTFILYNYITQVRHVNMPLITNLVATTWGMNAFKEKIFIRSVSGMIGVLLTLTLFPVSIAIPAVLAFSIGDSTAAIVGSKFGKRPIPFNPRKTFEGTLSGATFSALVLVFFLHPAKAVIGACVGATVEAFSPANDNLLIPLSIAVVLLVLSTF